MFHVAVENLDNDVPRVAQSVLPKERTRLAGEKVYTVEQACAILREGGGVILQLVRSGRHLDCVTFTKESRLRESFPTNLGKHDYVIAQGLNPNVELSPRW
ncbi:MAG TPA: hypothetical protein VMH91_02245 [Candidatus Paceibacterota bacterium]|nr:hypothetical protein [Candidatus Paceibacterota bacterium]